MIRDEEKYKQAIEFRKRGFTYSEIAKICGISKSTASAWLAKKAFSKRVKKDNTERAARDNVKRIGLVNKARRAERATRYTEAIHSAETEYKHYKANPLFIAGIVCYISNGDSADSSRIRLTTSEAQAHRIFIRFCTEYLGIEKTKINFWLLLYGNQKEAPTIKKWSKHINLPVTQFGKTQSIQQYAKRLQNGTGNTIIGSTVLKCKLNRWIELVEKDLSE